LDVLVNSNEPVSHALLTESIGVEPASPLFENQYLWVIAGITLTITAIVLEQKRRNKAKQLMHDLIASNQWV
jgi:hypothetical protein